MIRFVYPNVDEHDQFSGCGRYVVIDPSQTFVEEGYTLANPNIGHLSQITTAASSLGCDPFDSARQVYEYKDQATQVYRGDSMGLAYLLALMHCARTTRWDHTGNTLDIWCTGAIKMHGDKPSLANVYQNLFDIKLQAFLTDPKDRLFLVPAANLKQHHKHYLSLHNAVVLSLDQFAQLSDVRMFVAKTFVRIHGDELERLICTIFPSVQSEPVIAENPYRGLFAFREEDADVFFGRETCTQRLMDMVEHQSHVTLIGASGSGKSSLVYAGLLPRLRRESDWLIISFRPGNNPFKELAKVLIPLLYNDELIRISKIKELMMQFLEAEIELGDLIVRILEKDGRAAKCLLFVDQFEELYTSDQATYRQFLDQLLKMPSDSDRAGHLLLTMRADFLGKALAYRPFADILHQGMFMLAPMNRQELQHAIEEPARKYAVRFEKGLTFRILDALRGEPGSLPLLEFTLTQLWNKQRDRALTHATYEELGGVEHALAHYAERVYHTLSDWEQQRAQRIFTQLVHPGEGTEDTRRVAMRADISENDWPLVMKLIEARLVVTDSISCSDSLRTEALTEEAIEVVHEALLTKWQRLREWIDNDREFRMWQERLRNAMRQWRTSRHDEGALLRGALLAEAEWWTEQRGEDISQTERRLIDESIALRDKEHNEREQRRQQEIETAEKLRQQAEQQERIQRQWTRRAIAFAAALFLVAAIAIFFLIQATQQRAIAERKTIEAYSVSAKALLLSSDELGAMLAAIKAGKILQHAAVPEELRELVIANFQMIVNTIHEKNRLEKHRSPVFALAFSPDGTVLASGGSDRNIVLWNVADGSVRQTLEGHSATVSSLAFSDDNAMLASASFDKTIKVWDVDSGKTIMTFTGHSGYVYSVALHPDKRLIASGSYDQSIKLWELATGRESSTLHGHADAVSCVAFSPDGTLLASASDDQTIKLWDVDSGAIRRTLHGHSGFVSQIAFSPDGTMLVSGGQDRTITLWHVGTGQKISTLEDEKQSGFISSVAFSFDGLHIASGSHDSTVKLWSVESGAGVTSLSSQSDSFDPFGFRHAAAVYAVKFHPDGTMVASASEDATIRLWQIQKQALHSASPKELLTVGCRWIQSYITTNPGIDATDRTLCDDILNAS